MPCRSSMLRRGDRTEVRKTTRREGPQFSKPNQFLLECRSEHGLANTLGGIVDAVNPLNTTMKRLNATVLVPGDIILTTTTAAASRAIRVATRSDISHAMVYVQNCSVIDATGEGVHARNTQRIFFEE